MVLVLPGGNRGCAMQDPPTTRGFRGKPRASQADRVPPGQHLTSDFPVLSAGPTPATRLEEWSFSLADCVASLGRWCWVDFSRCPQSEVTVDIHCVTTWSKLDTHWRGVSIDTLLQAAGLPEAPKAFAMFQCDGDYTTNVPVA